MLYLRQARDPARGELSERVPVAELTAVGLERALLASDENTRRRELAIALARDPAVTAWVMHTAQLTFGRPIETFEEAVNWLAIQVLIGGWVFALGSSIASFLNGSR